MRDREHGAPHQCWAPGAYEVISEMSPVVWFSSFLGCCVAPQMCFSRHRMVFRVVVWVTDHVSNYPVVTSTMVSTWQVHLAGNITNLPGLSCGYRSHHPFYQRGSTPLITTRFTLMHNLCNGFRGQVQPSISSPSVHLLSPQMSQYYMGPTSNDQLDLMFPDQLYLNHFSFSSLIYLLIILVLFGGTALRHISIYIADF